MDARDGVIIGGRYRIESAVGQGGMAMVYRAVDLHTDQVVAVKLLKPEVIQADPQIVARFAREGEALRRLNHPNIVKVLATVVEADDHYVVMEYVGGGDLRDLLDHYRRQNEMIPIARVLNIALDLSDALARAHRMRIIHRDLKPANVLIAEDGTPRLTDFGVAHFSDGTQVTQTGQLIGTLAYISPEVVLGERTDVRGDIWAFGVLLYELLTLRRPFDEITTGALLNAILSRVPPSLAELRPDAPPALVALVETMLIKDRDSRIDSARLVGAQLEAILAGKEVPTDLDDIPSGSTPLLTDTPSTTPLVAMRPEDFDNLKTVTPSTPSLRVPPSVDTGERVPDWMAATGISPEDAMSTPRPPLSAPPPPIRLLLAVVLPAVILLLAAVGAFTLLNRPNSEAQTVLVEAAPPGTMMVLVAQFAGETAASTDAPARLIADDLRTRIEQNPVANIVIRESSEIITTEAQALAAAEQNGALVIVWGRADGAQVRANVQVGSLAMFPAMPIARETLTAVTTFDLTLTDLREQSIVPAIIAVLALTYTAADDAFEIGRVITLLSEMGEYVSPDVAETATAGHVLRTYIHYVADPPAALTSIDAAIERSARNPLLYLLRSAVRQRNGLLDLALEDINTAKRFNIDGWALPFMAEGQHHMIYTLDAEAAYLELSEAARRSPDDWYIRSLFGTTAYILGDYAQARDHLDASRSLNPEASFPYVFAVPLEMRDGRLVEGVAMLNEVFERFPDPALSERVIAAFYGVEDNLYTLAFGAFGSATLAQWRQVITDTDQMIAIDPAATDDYFSDVYLLRGFAYCNLDDLPAAEAAFTRLIGLHPDFVFAYAMRAEIRRQMNNVFGAGADALVLANSPQADLYAQLAPALTSGAVTCKNFFDVDLTEYLSGTGSG